MMPRKSHVDSMATHIADIVVYLRSDGTYEIIKDRAAHGEFGNQDRAVYGIFPERLVKIVEKGIKPTA